MEALRQPSWAKGKARQVDTLPAGEDDGKDEAGPSLKDPEDLALEARKSARFKALDLSIERLQHVDYGLPTERKYEVTVAEQVRVVEARRSVWSNPRSRTRIRYVKWPIPGSQCDYCLDHLNLEDGSPGQCNWAFCVAKCVQCWAASRGCYWDSVSHSSATGEFCWFKLREVRIDLLLRLVPKKRVVDEVSADEVPPEAAPKKAKKCIPRCRLLSVDEDEVIVIPMEVDEPPAQEPEKVAEARVPSRMSSPELCAAGVSGEYAAFDGPDMVPEPRSKSLFVFSSGVMLTGVSRSWRVRG